MMLIDRNQRQRAEIAKTSNQPERAGSVAVPFLEQCEEGSHAHGLASLHKFSQVSALMYLLHKVTKKRIFENMCTSGLPGLLAVLYAMKSTCTHLVPATDHHGIQSPPRHSVSTEMVTVSAWTPDATKRKPDATESPRVYYYYLKKSKRKVTKNWGRFIVRGAPSVMNFWRYSAAVIAPPYGPLPMLLMSAIFESSCLAYLPVYQECSVPT
jgi:hypothetical protein